MEGRDLQAGVCQLHITSWKTRTSLWAGRDFTLTSPGLPSQHRQRDPPLPTRRLARGQTAQLSSEPVSAIQSLWPGAAPGPREEPASHLHPRNQTTRQVSSECSDGDVFGGHPGEVGPAAVHRKFGVDGHRAASAENLYNTTHGQAHPLTQRWPCGLLPARTLRFHTTSGSTEADPAGHTVLTLEVMWKDRCPPTTICFFITLKRLNRQSRRPALCTRRLKSTSSHRNLLRCRGGNSRTGGHSCPLSHPTCTRHGGAPVPGTMEAHSCPTDLPLGRHGGKTNKDNRTGCRHQDRQVFLRCKLQDHHLVATQARCEDITNTLSSIC